MITYRVQFRHPDSTPMERKYWYYEGCDLPFNYIPRDYVRFVYSGTEFERMFPGHQAYKHIREIKEMI